MTQQRQTIGVLTVSRTQNYGAVLQAHALNRRLRELGFPAEIIDFRFTPPAMKHRLIGGVIKRIRRGDLAGLLRLTARFAGGRFFHKGGEPDAWQQEEIRKAGRFAQFQRDMNYSSENYSNDNIYLSPPVYDTYIVGSDQIWNYRLSGSLGVFLLDFVKGDARRIAYAASLGVTRIPLRLRHRYRRNLDKFDRLSVRESEGARIIARVVGKPVAHVLDPTLLMTAEEWQAESVRASAPNKYVLIYSLSGSPVILDTAYQLAKRMGLPMVTICPRYDGQRYPGCVNWYDAGPREFLSLVSGAALVVTDSFHGTAFAINFGVNFLVVAYSYWDFNNRIESICRELGLQDHYCDDNRPLVDAPPSIDYSRVHALLAEKRAQSLEWLRRSLET